MLKYNQDLKLLARELRNNMTKEERKLWYEFLNTSDQKFLRQKIIGNYIVDFYSHKAKLVIEIDGGQHYEPENKKIDKIRTEYLETLGLKVIRYTNIEINKNFEGVCEDIKKYL